MTKARPPHPPGLAGVDLQLLFVRPASERPIPERRNLAARIALLNRVRTEFLGMPGLLLTHAQATRLMGISPEACTRVLGVLIEEGIVRRTADGRYGCSAQAPRRTKSA